MNRELKFRAWDGKNMREVVSIYLEHDGIGQNVVVKELEGDSVDTLFSGYELMQYTSIKDKNGVEICEGDIVRYYDSTTMWLTSRVYDEGGAWAIKTPENPILLYEFLRSYEYDGSLVDELEVIGNIYQGYELPSHD